MTASVPVFALESLRLENAADLLAAARFAGLLARQSDIPDARYDRGVMKWLAAIEEGSEEATIRYAIEAIEEVRACDHPHADAIQSLVEAVATYTETVIQTRDPRFLLKFATVPFEPRGGMSLSGAVATAFRQSN